MVFSKIMPVLSYASLLILPLEIAAAPMISVDTADYNAGIIYQGGTARIDHTFIIRNTGDSTLKISRVKPGCGCTTVGYDSIIEPGKTGKISETVDIRNIQKGDFQKQTSVISNAKDSPELRLTVRGTIKTYIDLSKPEITMITRDKKTWSDSIVLKTDKPDLSVTEVAFKMYSSSAAAPSWQTNLNLYPTFTLTKIAAVNEKEKKHSYLLVLFFTTKETEPRHGEFTIKTNHPKSPDVKINGVINN